MLMPLLALWTMHLRRSLHIAAFTICVLTAQFATAAQPYPNNPALDARTLYDLQEKCGKDAAAWFKRQMAGESSTGSRSGYSNHYNARLNKCFAVIETHGEIHDEKTQQVKLSDYQGLWDVNENEDIGDLYMVIGEQVTVCRVIKQWCDSAEKWESLISVYMKG